MRANLITPSFVMSYACIFVPDFPAQAVVRLEPDLRQKGVAILAGAAPLTKVFATNRQARDLGVETGMTIDLMRKGLRITEVEVPLAHRATGKDWRSQLHRLRQLRDVGLALAGRRTAR